MGRGVGQDRLCQVVLRSRNVPVGELNAWQESYTDNPL